MDINGVFKNTKIYLPTKFLSNVKSLKLVEKLKKKLLPF
jgi:hypothetical protein